eukprot:Selendium_serpulae@DN6180_c0_g2_i1.p1
MRAFANKVNMNLENTISPQKKIPVSKSKFMNTNFMNAVAKVVSENCDSKVTAEDRLIHAHGHACQEIWALRCGSFPRVPDAVYYPTCLQDVEHIVRLANEHGVRIIPYGGGTNVTLALECPADENRMIVSVDLSKMQRLIYVDVDAMIAKVEAGIVGVDLDKELLRYGVVLGHEPDSNEFSTVGGWVATNASGMKKNAYGNIEDLVVDATVVTPVGTLSRKGSWARVSAGPDILPLVLGSEGIFGIVTDVTLKLRPVPEVKKFDCFLFPDFTAGVKFMREAALNRVKPASLRLMDNEQTQLGQAVKAQAPGTQKGYMGAIGDKLKLLYITKVKGFDVDKLCGCTVVYEGSQPLVEYQTAEIEKLAAKQYGFSVGGASGQLGYQMTFAIAYIRDWVLDHDMMAESFEMSVSWAKLHECVNAVKAGVFEDCKKHGVIEDPFVTVRVTQIYDEGVCLYYYLSFNCKNLENPIEVFSSVEHSCRQRAMEHGASISHHHGVGKIRKDFMEQARNPIDLKILRGIKSLFDPNSIMGANNLIDP